MGGIFGVASEGDCVSDLFYGTDYHSHLGTRRGGLAVDGSSGIARCIHDISNAQFRSKFDDDISRLDGRRGIGVISDYEDQPLLIGSHLGTYAIVTVGRVNNLEELSAKAFKYRMTHFSEMSGGEINQTELIATLINQESSFEAGIANAQNLIDGSCSLLLMTRDGIYAARDKCGRTPLIIGKKEEATAVTMETSAFPNLGYETTRYLGPGEIVLFDELRLERKKMPEKTMRICAFLWVYYGYPSSNYESINVEVTRNRNGALLAKEDGDLDLDVVAGIPDSGKGHAIGYANEAGIPFARPFVKYTPTWPRSFMPQNQTARDLVANMKLIPIQEIIDGNRLLFCDDSIVRGTQLTHQIQALFDCGAKEAHMRVSCPPLLFGCRFLNFSRSKSELDLAARRAIKRLEGDAAVDLSLYADSDNSKHDDMVESIRQELGLTSLRYQKLANLIKAIGLPAKNVCTYCWNGDCGARAG